MTESYISQNFPLYVTSGEFGAVSIVVGWRVNAQDNSHMAGQSYEFEMVPITVPIGILGYPRIHDIGLNYSTVGPVVDPNVEYRRSDSGSYPNG